MRRTSSQGRTRRRSRASKKLISPNITAVSETSLRQFLLVSYHEAPRFLADNEHIKSGYRVHFSWKQCLRSMFRMHNETLNIWTHLGGFILFVFLLGCMLATLSPYGFDYLHLGNDHVSDEDLQLHRGNICRMVDALRVRAPTWEGISERLSHLATSMKENINAPERIHQLCANLDRMRRAVTEMDEFHTLRRIDNYRKALRESVENVFHEFPDLPAFPFVDSTKHRLQEISAFLKSLHVEVPEMPSMLLDPLAFLPTWPLAVFLGAAIFCLFFSSVFHTFYCSSENTCVMLQQLDIAGICLLISGTTIPVMYYGFYCSEVLRTTYISTGVVFPTIAFVISMSKQMMSNEFAAMRAVVMGAVGLLNAVPLVHMLSELHDQRSEVFSNFLFWLMLGCSQYILGAIVFATRYPERLWPGKFDIFFHSHTLFHVFVVFAALCHYVALQRVFEWRMMTPCRLPEAALSLSYPDGFMPSMTNS